MRPSSSSNCNCCCSCSYITCTCRSFSSLRDRLLPWLHDYDRLQSFAVTLIYIQIGCALVGSLGAFYNGVLLINLGIALFALVAIESSSQSLARTYAVLLFCAILLDISWFILFSYEIWHISSGNYGALVTFSVKLTMAMQVIGFSVRLSSSLLWIQIYRLGVSYGNPSSTNLPRDTDFRNSFLSPVSSATVGRSTDSDDALGGSIYDPAYYSSLFECSQDNGLSYGGGEHDLVEKESASSNEASQLKPSVRSI